MYPGGAISIFYPTPMSVFDIEPGVEMKFKLTLSLLQILLPYRGNQFDKQRLRTMAVFLIELGSAG